MPTFVSDQRLCTEGIRILLIDDGSCACGQGMKSTLQQIVQQYPKLAQKTIKPEDTTDFSNLLELPVMMLLDKGDILGMIKGYQPFEIVEFWLEDILEKKAYNLQAYR